MVLMLASPIIMLANAQLTAFAEQLETIVRQVNVKTSLTFDMYTASRSRAATLQRMQNMTDPFELDEQRTIMSELAEDYITALTQLRKLPFTEAEKEAIDIQQDIVQNAAPAQLKVANLFVDGQFEEAHQLLYDVALPGQEGVLAQLTLMLELQKQASEDALRNVQAAREQTIRQIHGLSIGALVISTLIMFAMSRRISTAEKEREKAKQKLEQAIIASEAAHGAAEAANAEKSRFLANMSHELRTPMHAILSYTALALKRSQEEKIQSYLAKIQTSGQRLEELLANLLDLSKLQSGRMEPSYQETNLIALAKHSLESIKTAADARNIALLFDGPDNLGGSFDPQLIGKVITHLLANAIQYNSDNGRVLLQVQRQHTELNGRKQDILLIEIADTGIGVPQEELESIFEKFVQSSSTVRDTGGTGLGLPICKGIIAAHRGSIQAISPLPENTAETLQSTTGTSFQITIPVKQTTD